MRIILFLTLTVILSYSSNAKTIYIPANSTDNEKTGNTSTANLIGNLNAKAFILLTPAGIEEMTGVRMKLGQKISLKLVQLEVKKQLKKGKPVNMAETGKKVEGGINFLWVLVGFLLGIVGVLIAYLTKEGSDDNRVKSAWIGFGISALLIIVFYAVFFAILANSPSYVY